LFKVKISTSAAILLCTYQLLESYMVDAAETINWDGQEWYSQEETAFERGRIHYFSSNTEVCNR
jgi:hypothetical protein